MLQVTGAEGTPEFAAALAIREMILDAWPDITADDTCWVWLVANAKCHGQVVRDIDIMLLATIPRGISCPCILTFNDVNGNAHTPDSFEVRSLMAVIEVKDHTAEDVRIVGGRVEVRYRDGWKDASEQSHKQIFSVRNYLASQDVAAPYVSSLIWLRNVLGTDLPRRPHNILGTPLTWELLLNVIAQNAPPRWTDGRWVLAADQSYEGGASVARAAELFTRVLEPTRLDRLRMERIAQRSADTDRLGQLVGHHLLVLRGRGGTGKTMRLLQLANRLLLEEVARVLILTYNRALVADIRRLLTILDIPDDLSGGAIRIQTVHSFFYMVLRRFGSVPPYRDGFLEVYERLKDETLSVLSAGATPSVPMFSGDLDWDYVMIDEGQDWPDNERELLFRLYDPCRVVVSDGIDQLVRSTRSADWRRARPAAEGHVLFLRRSLRMKAGLARFVSALAREFGLSWDDWEPNEETPGGQVVIVDGPYLHDRTFHDLLVRRNAEDGNEPVDMLFCVPPSMVALAVPGQEPRSLPAVVFGSWGVRTWDGAVPSVRESYPTDVDQLRIVQYESCRGLEGWTVVNLALDRFYEHKLRQGEMLFSSLSGGQDTASTAIMPQRFAARWLTIPLTRAMDTLVIQLDHGASAIREAIERAAAECGDVVQWKRTR